MGIDFRRGLSTSIIGPEVEDLTTNVLKLWSSRCSLSFFHSAQYLVLHDKEKSVQSFNPLKLPRQARRETGVIKSPTGSSRFRSFAIRTTSPTITSTSIDNPFSASRSMLGTWELSALVWIFQVPSKVDSATEDGRPSSVSGYPSARPINKRHAVILVPR